MLYLNINCSYDITDTTLSAIVQNCPNLLSFKFASGPVVGRMFTSLLLYVNALKGSPMVTDAGLEIVSKLKKLAYVGIAGWGDCITAQGPIIFHI